MQMLWEQNPGTAYTLVDRHGGRLRYRKLLHDVFPELRIQIIRESTSGSVYRLRNEYNKEMWIAFKKSADDLAVPVSLASMTAKYLREIYMHAFNQYWQQHLPELKPTAGYAADAKRFLKDIKFLIQNMDVNLEMLVRNR
jgi:ribonuclease HII